MRTTLFKKKKAINGKTLLFTPKERYADAIIEAGTTEKKNDSGRVILEGGGVGGGGGGWGGVLGDGSGGGSGVMRFRKNSSKMSPDHTPNGTSTTQHARGGFRSATAARKLNLWGDR